MTIEKAEVAVLLFVYWDDMAHIRTLEENLSTRHGISQKDRLHAVVELERKELLSFRQGWLSLTPPGRQAAEQIQRLALSTRATEPN